MTVKFAYLNLIFLLVAAGSTSLSHAAPDLTIVGFFKSEDGIGKIPITILETLGDDISANFTSTNGRKDRGMDMPKKSLACINNPNHEAGNVALLTDLIWSMAGKPADKMPKESLVKLAVSMLETTKIPSEWTKILNNEFDAVVVPDPSVLKLYQNSGVTIPIFVLPLPMILKPYFERTPHLKTPNKPFVFGDFSANKNPAPLIQAFSDVFKNNPDVRLLLRAAFLNSAPIQALILKNELKNVTYESSAIALTQYIDKLQSIDCYVNLSCGEGFSYIPRECLSLGIPVIITNNTASTTICNSGFVRAVPSRIEKAAGQHYQNHFGDPCGNQFHCEVQDVVKALKDVYENYSEYHEKAIQGREWVKQYDCCLPQLQSLYRALIKPKHIRLGSTNVVTKDTLTTTSKQLHDKYLKISKTE